MTRLRKTSDGPAPAPLTTRRVPIALAAGALLAIALAAYSQQPPAPAAPPAPGPRQPVLILLNTRFYDHTHPQFQLERIRTVLAHLRQLRQQYPGAGISSVFQFSGSMSEVLFGLSAHQPEVQQVKDAVAAGLIELGYTGEDEPTYGNRPQADFLFADTPEQRWLARTDAAERFLSDYKDPVTGDPVPGLTGGFRRMQEVFGQASYVSGLTQNVGDNSPFLHQLRRQNTTAIVAGFPDFDRIRGITEYRAGVAVTGKMISPLPNTSPEVFWEDNVLHSSDTGGPDTQSLNTEQGPEALKAAFDAMDRSKVRVVHMEIGSYLRYLKKGPDGKPVYPPLEWAYSHPLTPEMPPTLKEFDERSIVAKSEKKEQDSLQWLLEHFLPENPGSRFVSVADLKRMAPTALDTDVSQARLRVAASDLLTQYARWNPTVPSFVHGEDEYFSLADMFELLSGALADFSRTGALPPAVKLTNVYGPLELAATTGINEGEFSVESISRVSAGISEVLRDQTWKPAPSNAVPTWVTVDGVQVNATQFLLLMAQAYLDPVPAEKMKVERSFMISPLAGAYPRRILPDDIGNAWTLKPAPLRVPVKPPPPPVMH